MNMFKPMDAKTPEDYINKLAEPRKSEIQELHTLIKSIAPKLDIKMYHNIIGYGSYPYKTKSGQSGEWFVLGLASQKNYISVYACTTDGDQYIAEKHKDQFPKANIGRSCIRFKKLEDIDTNKLKSVLKEAITAKKLGHD